MGRVRVGKNQQKILLLLFAGLTIGLSGSPTTSFKVIRATHKEWHKINNRALREAIRSLYESNLIDEKHHTDGTVTIILSKEGKRTARRFDLDAMHIKTPSRWDGKWRLVVFDIPEKLKRGRNALREHLKELDFYELQRSVFVHPFECSEEIEFLLEFYGLKSYVRLATIESIDNDLHLRKKFNLA